MRCTFLLFFLLGLFACQLEKQDLSGYWISSNYSSPGPIKKLAFHNDTIQLVYETNVSQNFKYQLKNNQLFLQQKDTVLSKEINQLIGDTLWIDSVPFQRVSKTDFEYFPSIDLIDFPTNRPIDLDNYPSYQIGLVLNDSLQLILGDKKAELADLAIFLSCYHCERANRKAYIFIDKSVELIDLSMVYDFLKIENIREIYLITQKKGTQYYGLQDRVQIWEKDLVEFCQYFKLPQPPPFQDNYKSTFIKTHQPLKEYTINSADDGMEIIKKAYFNHHCIINIPPNRIPVTGYLRLKLAYQSFRMTQRQALAEKYFQLPFDELTLKQKRYCLKDVKTIRFNLH